MSFSLQVGRTTAVTSALNRCYSRIRSPIFSRLLVRCVYPGSKTPSYRLDFLSSNMNSRCIIPASLCAPPRTSDLQLLWIVHGDRGWWSYMTERVQHLEFDHVKFFRFRFIPPSPNSDCRPVTRSPPRFCGHTKALDSVAHVPRLSVMPRDPTTSSHTLPDFTQKG